jgi:predicted HAD superfamily Cof-like phosphohydrolase
MSNIEDVEEFHFKFGIEVPSEPAQLTTDVAQFRIKFMQEELDEYVLATAQGDVEGQIDALVDLVYVALGTSDLQGFNWQAHWNEVQRANMSKVRAENADDPRSKRKHAIDVVKPEGWTGPDHVKVFDEEYN